MLDNAQTAAQAGYSFQPNARAVPSLDTLKGFSNAARALEMLRITIATAPLADALGTSIPARARIPAVYDLYFQRFRQVFSTT